LLASGAFHFSIFHFISFIFFSIYYDDVIEGQQLTVGPRRRPPATPLPRTPRLSASILHRATAIGACAPPPMALAHALL